MAVLTGLKPTTHTVYDSSGGTLTNVGNLYDASDTTEGNAYMPSSAAGPIVDLKGWDFSALPDDATITGITATFRMRSSSSGRSAGIHIHALNSHSPTLFTGVQTTSTTYQTLSRDFPVDWLNAITPAALKDPGAYFAVRFVLGYAPPGRVYFSDFYLEITYELPPPPAHGNLYVTDEKEVVSGTGGAVISASLPIVDEEDVFEAVLDFPDFFVVRMAITDGGDEVSGDSTLEVKGRVDITDAGEVVGATGTVTIDSDLSIEDLGDIVEMATTDIRPGPVAHINAVRSADRKTTTLTWSTAQRASRYQIMRSDDMRGTWEELAETTATTYTDSHYNATANYTYSVYAVSASGHRGQSSPPAYSFGVDFARRVTL